MQRRAPITFACIAVALDWIAVAFALGLAFWIRFHSGLIAAPKGIPRFESYLPGFVVTALGWSVIFAFLGLYDTRKGLTRSDEALLVLKGTVLGSLLTMSTAFLYRGVSYSRLHFVISIPLALLAVVFLRSLLRKGRAWARRRGIGLEKVLLVGGGRLAEEIRRRIDQRPDFGYTIVGAISDEEHSVPEGIRSLGPLEEVEEICRSRGITRVFIALPERRRHLTVEVLRACENLPIEFEIVPDLFSQIGEKVRLTDMDGIPLLGVKAFPLQAWNRFVKRTFDILISSLLLLLLLPLFLLLALLIRLESRGPVFYWQRRIGRDGRVFMIAKFRSMVAGAERETGPVWASAGDPRQTRVGSFLRRTSLDELPQLWNVLRGEMSLVGPRPERPHFVEQFQKVVPRYYDRHRVKSGMTGWAQVNGFRGNTSIEERTRYDVFYVENWSLLFDVKILVRTAKHVARHALQPHSR